MKTIRFIILTIVATAIVACATQNEPSDISNLTKDGSMKITATLSNYVEEDEVATKTAISYVQGAGASRAWALSDTLGVFPHSGDQTNFAMSSGVGTSHCSIDGGGWGLKPDTIYTAYFPFSRANYVSAGKKKDIRVSYLGQKQNGKDQIDLGAYDFMAAVGTTPFGGLVNFAMQSLNNFTVIDVTFPVAGVYKSIELTTDEDLFTTEGSIDLTQANIAVTPITLSNKMTLGLRSIEVAQGETVRFYMMLAPVDLSEHTLSLTATTIDNVQYTAEVQYTTALKVFNPGKTKRLLATLQQTDTREITLTSAGTLQSLLGDDYLTIKSIKLSGPINSDDTAILKTMAKEGQLIDIDISNCSTGSSINFESCSNLERILLPHTMTTIADKAFKGCASLKNIIIPEGVISIGGSAFFGSGLVSVTLPSTLTTLQSEYANGLNSSFFGCYQLAVIYNHSSLSLTKGSTAHGYVAYYADVIYNLSDDTLEKIGDFLFVANNGENTLIGYEGKAPYISLPDSFNGSNYSIGDYAFYNRNDISGITLSSGISRIGAHAFDGCSSIKTINIPNSVTRLDDAAFQNCAALHSAYVGNSVIYIGKDAFKGCTTLYKLFLLPNSIPNDGVSGGLTSSFVALAGRQTYVSSNNYSSYSSVLGNINVYSNLSSYFVVNDVVYVLASPSQRTCVAADCNYNGTVTDIVIPEKVNYMGVELSVISVNAYMAYDSDRIESVDISHKGNIETYAFNGCDRIKTVRTANAGYVGTYSFAACINITSASIQNGGAVSPYAFAGSSTQSPAEYEINNSGIIDAYAFQNASAMSNLTIGSSVTSIGGSAFANCSGITHAVIRNTGYIGAKAFYQTSTTSPAIYDINNAGTIENQAFFGCSKLDRVTIGPAVSTIGQEAFKGCSGITYANIGNSAYLAENAFSGASTGDDATYIINSIGDIKANAFNGCTAINDLTVGETVRNIEESAFAGAASKSAATFRLNNSGYIGANAFKMCTALQNLNVASSVDDIAASAFSGAATLYPATFIINNTGALGTDSFKSCTALDHLEIGPTVTTEGATAFSGCTGITYAKIRNSGQISSQAFMGSSTISMAEYDIDNNGEIAQKAFYQCSKISQLSIGANVTDIGESAFASCSTASGCNAEYTIMNIGEIGVSAFSDCTNMVTATIGNEIPSIGEKAFYNCASLSNLTIGAAVATIGFSAFEKCSALPSVTLSNAVNDLGYRAFEECASLASVVIGNAVPKINYQTFMGCTSLASVTIGTAVSSIDYSAFQNCSSLQEIVIPGNVNSIGDYVFNGCTSLANVTIEDDPDNLVLGFNAKGSSATVLGKGLFYDCPLNAVYLGRPHSYNTALQYGYSPFYRNAALTSVNIGDLVPTVFENEFYGCTSLRSVDIGEGCTSIGNYAFSGDTSLDLFEIGSNVASIGNEAFSDCSAMTKFTSYCVTPPTLGSQALDDINKWRCHLWVPETSASLYQAADQWKEFLFVNN